MDNNNSNKDNNEEVDKDDDDDDDKEDEDDDDDKHLIHLCPKHKTDDLFKLIDNNTDATTIKSTILDWMLESIPTPTDTTKSP